MKLTNTMKPLQICCLGVIFALSILLGTGTGFTQNAVSHVPGRILVKFGPELPASHAQGLLRAAGARSLGQIPDIGVHVIQLPSRANERAFAKWFEEQPEVEFAEPDYIYEPDATPNDPYYKSAWHLPKIAGPAAWDTETGSSGVIVAILDTGVDGSHSDLASKMVPGWNFYDNNADTGDVHGHGTKVAGAAAASSNNSTGVAAVAWGCLIMPIRISDPQGYGYTSAMASGLTWAANNGARVANISYMVSESSTVTTAAKYFMSQGGVVTISAGNYSNFVSSPDNPHVLTVSATDSNDNKASWSNYGNIIDLAAPGVSIYTTLRGGGYGGASGTSFSAPVTAGVAALVISANPALTGEQVQDVLKQSADDLGSSGWDTTYGWGRVNAARAVELALRYETPPPAPSPSPTPTVDTLPPTVSITSPSGGMTVSGTVKVYVNAADDVGVVKVELYVDGKLTATSTSAPFTTNWNTRKASSGAHTLQCIAYDAAGNTGVSPVITVYKSK